MSKVLYTYEFDMPTVSICRKNVMSTADKTGIEFRFKQVHTVTKKDVEWCDALVAIRPNDPYSTHLAKIARESGRFVMVYYDDDLYNLPNSMANPCWRKNNVLKILQQSNMLSSSSHYVCKKYEKYTIDKRSFVGNTLVEYNEVKEIPPLKDAVASDKIVKLIYAANSSHTSFFNQYILPIMPKLCERYRGKISMTFMGVRPNLAEYESQIDITYHSTMPLAEYRQAICEGDFDIGLSPMTTNEFTKCKYFNKFIEYTMAGIVGVYSDTEPYTYVVKHGENGLLAKEEPEDWYKCLCQLIDDSLLRNRCIRVAQALLKQEFNTDALLEKEAKAVPELRTYIAEKKSIRSLQPQKFFSKYLFLLDRIYQVLFYLKRAGVSGLFNKITIHLRESKAYSK